jgi:prophage regulatory protein
MKNRSIIKLPQVKELTKLSQATIYRLISTGVFPKQIKLAERSSGWLEQEVFDYLDSCIKHRK